VFWKIYLMCPQTLKNIDKITKNGQICMAVKTVTGKLHPKQAQ